jgi:protein involved in polysaccharide export with SLBB domain
VRPIARTRLAAPFEPEGARGIGSIRPPDGLPAHDAPFVAMHRSFEKHLHSAAVSAAAGIGALFGLLAAAGCVSAPPLVESTAPSDGVFGIAPSPLVATLGPGDTLSISVVGHPDLARPETPVRIDAQGCVNLPLVGSIEVAGLTVAEGRDRIQTAFARYLKDASVGLAVAVPAARQAYVLGEVDRPGAFVLERPIDALQLLALAGGVKDGGDRTNVALMRAQGDELYVHFFDAATPDLGGAVAVHPGDLVFVRLSRGGAFKEQVVPVLQAAAPIFSSITSLIVVSDALDD